ncbi:hypothetical protein [Streptomyces sp. NPDC048565]|uniref:hypothetical protein n=1 Tax=Streptomyces sp. NPDC048565 TaxID=3155266 RepID=UPI003439F8B0
MMIRHVVITGVATASLAFAFTPAVGAPTQGSHAPAAQAPDGLLHAWTDAGGRGHHCTWGGPSDNWGTCRNAASDIWNNGTAVTLDAVDLYWGTSGTGAHACISRGDSWNNLPVDIHKFTYGQGLGGFGESVNDNISSHRWVDYCSQG